jgi:predicted nucleic acid-binding protein
MPKPRVYVETTIPNFYYDFRPSPAVAERREWTRLWWADAADRYELMTGSIVLDKLQAGTSPLVKFRLALLDDLPLLPQVSDVLDIVDVYLRHKLMPAKPVGDAVHLALASYYKCDFIVTWNCHHLANPNKVVHIQRINGSLGLPVPRIVTPLNLLAGGQDDGALDRSG